MYVAGRLSNFCVFTDVIAKIRGFVGVIALNTMLKLERFRIDFCCFSLSMRAIITIRSHESPNLIFNQ